ncbi:MAG: hypothetical protein KIT10_08580 [Flavobacteriales bacterium]|nr:hypothetical protein [Flavobacteriales bacterium]
MRCTIARLAFIPWAATALGQTTADGWTIPGRFDLITTDEMGHVYALQGDELILFDTQGQERLRNSVKTFGRIAVIDAFYSFKPMVFSPGQGQLAVLDNTLAVQGSIIHLPRNGFPQVVLVCMSVQNGFWLFDERDLQAIRVDAQLRRHADTGRLDQLLGFTPKPVAMQEYDSRLYMNDPKEGILVFDLFGTYVRTIPIRGATRFEVRGHTIVYVAEGRPWAYDMRDFTTTPLELGAKHLIDVRVERGLVYLHEAERIRVLRWPRTP